MKIKIYTFLVIVLATLLSNTFAYTGGWGSGGGKAIVCFDSPIIASRVKEADGVIESEYLGNITYLETLDLFHAKNTNRENMVDSIKTDESYVEFLNRIIAKIQEVDPIFARDLMKSKSEFNKRIIGFQHGPVDTTNDENYTDIQLIDTCALTNVAVQKWDPSQEGYRLHIDMRLFTHMRYTEESKSVLLLHEYLYQVARDKGERDSRSTRILISAILSIDPEIKLEDFISEFSH